MANDQCSHHGNEAGSTPEGQGPTPTNSKDGKKDEPQYEERFKGLCMNCENRFDCLLPRPEGGVWHCEEYR